MVAVPQREKLSMWLVFITGRRSRGGNNYLFENTPFEACFGQDFSSPPLFTIISHPPSLCYFKLKWNGHNWSFNLLKKLRLKGDVIQCSQKHSSWLRKILDFSATILKNTFKKVLINTIWVLIVQSLSVWCVIFKAALTRVQNKLSFQHLAC